MDHVLIIRFSSLGDVILATAVADAVRRLWPNARQTFVVKEEYSSALKHNTYIDRVMALGVGERGFRQIIDLGRSLKCEKIDVVVDLQGGPRGRMLARGIGARHTVRPRSHRLRRMLMAERPGLWRKPLPHVVERYLDCLKPLADGRRPNGRPEVFLTPEERTHALEVVDEVEGSALIALSPGAKWPAKQWPEEYFARLGSSLTEAGFGVLLLGSNEEKALLDRVASKISKGDSTMAVAGDLRLLATLFSISTAAVCNDSGLMHLSAAVDTPTIGIFGPTAPHFGFEPFGDRHKTLWMELECSPCSLHGEKRCRKGEDIPCMSLIDPDRVFAELRPILESVATERGSSSEIVRGDTQCGM